MRIFLYILGTLFLLCVIAIVAIPFMVSPKMVEDQITQYLAKNTDLRLEVQGKTSIRVFPEIGLSMTHARLTSPHDRDKAPLLKTRKLNIGLQVLPLLSGKYQLNTFSLSHPTINLRMTRAGKSNWDPNLKTSAQASLGKVFKGLNHIQKITNASWISAPAHAATSQLAQLEKVSIGKIHISKGTLNYTNDKTGQKESVKKLDLTLRMPSIDRPFSLASNFNYKTLPVTFNTDLLNPRGLISGGKTPYDISGKSTGTTLQASGNLGLEPLNAAGPLSLKIANINNLLRPLKMEVAALENAGPLSIEGQTKIQQTKYGLHQSLISLGATKAQGDISANLAKAKPMINAVLNVQKLNLNPFLASKAPVKAWEKRTGPKPVRLAQRPQNINDLLNKKKRRSASSSHALSGLLAFNADATLKVKELIYQKLALKNNDVKLKLRNGNLVANLNKAQLFDGTIIGQATVNAKGRLPKIGARFQAKQMPARPLLNDLADFDWLSGRANITGNITTVGVSDPVMRRNLNGTVNMNFTDGAIEGINIAQTMRGLTSGSAFGMSKSTSEKTDFSELSGKVILKKGVAHNNDLLMVSPLLRLTGKGQVNLVRNTINYVATPKIVGSLRGQGGKRDLDGVAIPLKIKGKLASPKVEPDLKALLKDPSAILKGAKSIEKSLRGLDKDGAVGDFLGGLVGGDDNKKNINADKLLKGLFR